MSNFVTDCFEDSGFNIFVSYFGSCFQTASFNASFLDNAAFIKVTLDTTGCEQFNTTQHTIQYN